MTDAEWAAIGAMMAAVMRGVVWLLDRRDARRHREELERIRRSTVDAP